MLEKETGLAKYSLNMRERNEKDVWSCKQEQRIIGKDDGKQFLDIMRGDFDLE